MNADPLDGRCPVTILTGWLGAGKTTLLNRILSNPQGGRFAVLVNEFGEIGIDDKLVIRGNDNLIELSNGCVCCTVRGDLVTSLHGLFRRRPPFFRRPRFDRVLIETTGIAEPAPLMRTFLVEEEIAEKFRVDALLTLVDALHANQALKENAAEDQIALADLLLLNKTDLVDAPTLEELRTELARRNPLAPCIETQHSRVDLQEVLANRGQEPARLHQNVRESKHDHNHSIQSICIQETRALDPLKAQLWLNSCASLLSGKLVRFKGILHLAGEDHRGILQGVYELYSVSSGEAWEPDRPRVSEIVFIGRDLDEDFLKRGLEACLAE